MKLTVEWLTVSIEEIENYRIGEEGCVYAGSYGYGKNECYVVAISRELKNKSEHAHGCASTKEKAE